MSTPFARRSYAGGAASTTIPSAINAAVNTFDVAAGTAYPTTNFFCVIDLGTATEEKIFVGNRTGNTFSIVARGEDGTVGKTHAAGATVHHIGAAQDFDESNVVASTLTTKGDILVKGPSAGPARLPVGANGSVLTADSAAALGMTYQQLVPAGTIMSGCWAAAPTGYLMLDGSTLIGGQTDFPNLWAVIPIGWKSGANIVLPDCRGRVLAGAGTGTGLTNRPLGAPFGEESHALSISEMPGHDHGGLTVGNDTTHAHAGTTVGANANHTHAMAGYTAQTFVQMATSASSGVYAAANPWTPADGIQTGGYSNSHGHDFTTNNANATHSHIISLQGGTTAHNNMPPAIAVSWVIKT